jgi:peptidyl-prolyl cis-trans isomerase C
MLKMALMPVLVILALLAVSCGTRPLGEGEVARIGSRVITMEELEKELQRIPPYQRATFETLRGRHQLLSHMIERELLLAAAIDEGLENDPAVLAQVALGREMVESVRRRAMTQAFYQTHVMESVTVPDSMILAYYQEHLDTRFTRQATASVQHILVADAGAMAEARAMLDQGIPFDSVAAMASEHAVTRGIGGRMGTVEENGSIPYLGNDPVLAARLLGAREGELVGPVETSLGIHLFLVTEVTAAGHIPLEDARRSIESILKPALVNEYFKNTLIPRLHERYQVEVYDEPGAEIVARVGELVITREDIESAFAEIPYYQRDAYDTPEGRQILLGSLIEQELLTMAAGALDMEQDSFVVAQVELAMEQADMTLKSSLIQEYYNRFVVAAAPVPEDRILQYYNSHLNDIYHRNAQTRLSVIVTDRGPLLEDVQTRLQSGVSFDSLAAEVSIHHPTASVNGDLGWVSSDSPLPYLGGRPDFTDELLEAPVGSILGPYTTSLGVTFFKVTDSVEAGPRPLSEVRDSIEAALRPEVVNSYLRNTVFPTLMEKYGVEINEEAFLPSLSIGPDSLMSLAQAAMASDPGTAVRYFSLFVDRYPDNRRCDQAVFFKGFTLSEKLGDYDAAREAFRQVVEQYPDSDLADDAQWMIENMEKPIDMFIPITEETTETVL